MSKKSNQDVELVFLPPQRVKEHLRKVQVKEGPRKVRKEVEPEEVPVKINEFVKWFKGFKVDSIELSLQFAVKSGQLVQLFVSFEGGAGCKVVLKPIG